MSQHSQNPNADQLLQAALAAGSINQNTFNTFNVNDLGANINQALGVNSTLIPAVEVTLVNMLVDDSSSIRFRRNAQNVRDGYNLCLDALNKSNKKEGILIHTRFLNGEVFQPYISLAQAKKLDSSNYNPNGITPLYDQTVVFLATVAAKVQEFANNGVPAQTITLIVTDGNDEGSLNYTGNSVFPVINDMLSQEIHIISAMGIDDGSTDFKSVFTNMGIQPDWILTPNSDPKEIRRAWQQFSDSARIASQTANFSTMGGFNV